MGFIEQFQMKKLKRLQQQRIREEGKANLRALIVSEQEKISKLRGSSRTGGFLGQVIEKTKPMSKKVGNYFVALNRQQNSFLKGR